MIYTVPNFSTNIVTYVCPDEQTINSGKQLGFKGNFIVGTQSDATILIQQSKEQYLPLVENQFVVNKDIDPDPVNTTWIPCNLDTEQPNTDIDYNVFDVQNGYYNSTTGLDNAKLLLAQTKQDYLNWCLVVTSFETWPPYIRPKSNL